jgi:hypothetical protein
MWCDDFVIAWNESKTKRDSRADRYRIHAGSIDAILLPSSAFHGIGSFRSVSVIYTRIHLASK